MKIRVNLSIGYPAAERETTLKINDEDIKDLTEEEKEDYFIELATRWADNYIEIAYEEVE